MKRIKNIEEANEADPLGGHLPGIGIRAENQSDRRTGKIEDHGQENRHTCGDEQCGIDAFMRTVALEYGPKGIRCNSVNPGMVETALIGGFTEEQKEKEKLNYPLRRFAKPEDIAWGVVYLLSDASSFVTGTALKIDGGMTLS